MKELSIEEKAKRYDEAIKLINSKWYYKNQPCFINVSELFPEFKENKDENIKKWLIEYFQEYKSTGIEGFANGLKIDSIIDWLEKQDKQNSVDKIEPKFKVGDWIVFNGLTLYINEIVKGYYRTTSIDDIPNSYDWDIDNVAKLWTIKDAKDGDVLASKDGQNILIFKNLDTKNTFSSYYNVKHLNDIGWSANYFIPATIEQYNLLFQRMKEENYNWNADTKVLNKVIIYESKNKYNS